MKFQTAPIWFFIFLENERAFLPSAWHALPERQIKPFNMICFSAFLPGRKMAAWRKNFFVRGPEIRIKDSVFSWWRSRWFTKTFSAFFASASGMLLRKFFSNLCQAQTMSTPFSSSARQKTTSHRTAESDGFFKNSGTSFWNSVIFFIYIFLNPHLGYSCDPWNSCGWNFFNQQFVNNVPWPPAELFYLKYFQ